jgi:hypothetical protein
VVWCAAEVDDDDDDNDQDTIASIENATLSIFCGANERLKVPIEISASNGETEYASIGKFHMFEEVSVVLATDTLDSHDVVDKISIPIICLDRKKPSDLTLEELDLLFTISFKVLPLPPSEFIDNALGAASSAKETSKRSLRSPVTAIEVPLPSTPSQLSIQPSPSSSQLNPSKRKHGALVVRLSDVYMLIRGLMRSLAVSNFQMAVATMETLQSLTQHLLTTSRILVSISMDIGMEVLQAIDETIIESLTALDDTLAAYRDVAANCLRAVIEHLSIQNLERSAENLFIDWTRQLIRFPVRWTKPILKLAVGTATPVFQVAKPFVIDPHLERARSARQHFISYPIVGNALVQTEKLLDFTLREVSDELQRLS